MKIAIFGATGRVGAVFLQTALQDGHQLQALVRNKAAVTEHSNLQLIAGDAMNRADIEHTIAGCDVVFSALNTDGTTTLSEAIEAIEAAMRKHNIKRIVTIGTAGILNSREEQGKLRYLSLESKRRSTFAASEHEKVFRTLEKTSLNWTIICPTALVNDEEKGIYRYEKNFLPINGQRISVMDTAKLSYEAVQHALFVKERIGLAY